MGLLGAISSTDQHNPHHTGFADHIAIFIFVQKQLLAHLFGSHQSENKDLRKAVSSTTASFAELQLGPRGQSEKINPTCRNIFTQLTRDQQNTLFHA